MKFKDQDFLVYGMGISGECSAKKLLSLGAKVFIHDDNAQALESENIVELLKNGAKKFDGEYIPKIIILSPGVPIDSPFIVSAKRSGKTVIGEVELGYRLTLSPIIAVSGTNGKTTVSSLIRSALNLAGERAYLAGNIGAPITDEPTSSTPSDVTVAEISSFQLESVKSFKPHIGVMLNVKEDHLDRHYTVENYIYLKKRLFANMGATEYAVLNRDDQVVSSFAKDLKCKILWFSKSQRVDGAYLDNGCIFFNGEEILSVDRLSIKGEHNVENALAAVCALKAYGVATEFVESALTTFKGASHRLAKICEIDGVSYFDDSKATNVDSATKAVAAMTSPTVIILGGEDKGQGFSSLFKSIKDSSVYHAVLMGKCRFKLLETALECGFDGVSLANSFESAVNIAKGESKKGGAVLLSPACASFDMFDDYKQRGDRFIDLIKGENE